MLFNYNLIEALTGLELGFLPNDDNTVVAGPPHKTGSQITQEFDKVTFVELRKNTSLYMKVDDNKDVVVSVGPWRMLAFVNNDAGSGVDKRLRQMEEYREIGNLILVPASGDDLFKRIMKDCEAGEKEEKKTSKPESKKRKRQARGFDSTPESTAERPPKSTVVVIPPGSFDDTEEFMRPPKVFGVHSDVSMHLPESDAKHPPESTTTTTAAVIPSESLYDPEKPIDFFGGVEEKEKTAKPKRKRQARGSDSDFKPTAERLSESDNKRPPESDDKRLPEPPAIAIPPFDDVEELMRQLNPKPAPEPAVILDVEEDDD